MKVLEVAPISKIVKKNLTYFTSKNIKKGAVVSVNLRKKEIPAIVVSAKEARKEKTKIRLSPYKIKAVNKIKSQPIFLNQFLEAAEETARYFLVGPGAIINELSPKFIFKNPKDFQIKITNAEKLKRNAFLLIEDINERIKFYKSLIRSEFAKNHSLFFCLPSIQETNWFFEKLKTGIENFTFRFHSQIKKSELRKNWQEAIEKKHPIIIIATSAFLSLPRKDISFFILEKEGSDLYKEKIRPFLNIKTAVENLSKKMENSLILADEIPTTETYYQFQTKKIQAAVPIPMKNTSQAKKILVDMKNEKFILSEELKSILISAEKQNEHIVLFINRKGYETSTLCNDCGKIITCPRCDAPLILYKNLPFNQFICHKCFLRLDAFNNCPFCKSWRLKTFGFGIQKVYEELAKIFPASKIFQLDRGLIKSKKEGKEIIENYLNSGNGILLATELLFSFLNEAVEKVAVISIDSLFNIPNFRINEQIFRLLKRLESKSLKTFLIQTKFSEYSLFKHFLKGDLEGFYKSELEFRKKFKYPPFKKLIKIGKEGKNKEKTEKEIYKLANLLADYQPIVYPSFISKIKNIYRFNLLLKLDPEKWPAELETLRKKLNSLSPDWKIDIDPTTLV